MGNYRPNVAAILQRPGGEILVAERSGMKDAWQFPQGGVDEGESHEEALHRELMEEIGVSSDHYEVIDRKKGYRYDYPAGHDKGPRYRGQEQTYFLCRFLGTDEDICLERGGSREFSRYRWIMPEKFRRDWLPEFKVRVYKEVMKDFFGLKI